MSGLTGYLTTDGTDLSNLFIPFGGGTFTGAITTNAGIIGPSTSITYSDGMIGYITTVSTNLSNNSSISSGFKQMSASFTFSKLGMYLCVAYTNNVYSSSGSFTDFSIGISTSPSSSSGGFFQKIQSPTTLPSTGLKFISGHLCFPFQVTSTTQTYYLIQNITYTGITVNSPSNNNQPYFRYVRIA